VTIDKSETKSMFFTVIVVTF